MITDLAQAINTKFAETPAGDALRLVLSGGLWFTEAKDDVAFPYGVFTWDGSTIDEMAGSTQAARQQSRIETAQLTFSLYSKNDDGGLELFDIITKFIALFDWADLAYPAGSTYTPISMERESIVNRGKIDNVWTFDLAYSVMYEH